MRLSPNGLWLTDLILALRPDSLGAKPLPETSDCVGRKLIRASHLAKLRVLISVGAVAVWDKALLRVELLFHGKQWNAVCADPLRRKGIRRMSGFGRRTRISDAAMYATAAAVIRRVPAPYEAPFREAPGHLTSIRREESAQAECRAPG